METEKQKIRKEYERKEGQVDVKKKMCAPCDAAARALATKPTTSAARARVLRA